MAVRLVALDIDGTLLRGHGQEREGRPAPVLERAVRALGERGIAVVLASGRMFPGTRAVAAALGLRTPMICQQGCSVHLPDGTITHEFPIEHGRAMDIIEYARAIERPYEWFNPLRYVVSKANEQSDEYGRVSGITPEYRPDPENAGFHPTGVGIITSREEANGVHAVLAGRHGEALHLLDFPAVTVAVAPEASKARALALVCADLGIDRTETVAVGDSVNDAPMLEWAGRGYAMPGSDRYAVAAASEVLAGDGPEPLAALLGSLAR